VWGIQKEIMSKRDTLKGKYVAGDHYIICDRTGRRILASDARKEWNGYWVHKDEYEPKHPALIPSPAPIDKIAAPQPVRTEPTDVFVDVLDTAAYWDDDMVEGDDDFSQLIAGTNYVDMG